MTNPGELIDSLVLAYQRVPEFVQEHGGDPAKIIAYVGKYPEQSSLARAIYGMTVPGTMIVYDGFQPGRTGGMVWAHRVRIIHRCRPGVEEDTARAYLTALWLLVNGKPNGQELRMIDFEVHPNFDSMEVPSLNRQSLIVDQAGNAIDYFELLVTMKEKGDY